ncbi:MAG TPA: TonB-dependent receptor [Sphingobium sp.]
MTSSRKTSVRTSLALSCVGSMLLPLGGAVHAQVSTAGQGEPRVLGGMTVTDTALTDAAPAVRQSSPKAVRPVRDTPQTITVLGKDVLQQQNLISLQDALSTVPGITFGAGEGGSGFGDNINLRGYSANNDITLDGVRDSAQYSRTDSFNVEQIEVTNGASSVQNGSGSVGGNINLVSKRPLERDQAIFSAGIGTDNYYRATADVNRHLNDDIAFRLNGMFHRNDVPGRQVEKSDRWGIAPSITVGMSGPTQFTLSYVHQEDVNIPQFGVPYFTTPTYRGQANTPYVGALPGVDRSAYYGYRNLDTQRINLNQINLILDHAFSDTVSLRNYTRYQEVKQFTITDGPEGVFCLPNGTTISGGACTASVSPGTGLTNVPVPVAAGTFFPTGGSRGNTRDTRNRLLYNQTDLKAVVNTGFIEHTLDLGVSFSREVYNARSGNSERAADGTFAYALGAILPYNNINPNNANSYIGPVNFVVATRPRARIQNYAIYLFDAAKLGSHFEINGGVRLERSVGQSQTTTLVTVPGATFGQVAPDYPASQPSTGVYNFPTAVHNNSTLFSYRVGLVYKPVEAVSLYVAYGNSRTPSQTTVNSAGSCSIAGQTALLTATSTSTCSTRPEGVKNYEIGAKAELLNGGLLLTAALFRNDRDSYKVASNTPGVADQQLDGHSRVDGVMLGASGHITPEWSITANYSYLDSKLLQSVSNLCLANPSTACGNSLTVRDPAAGAPLNQAPKHSGSIYTAYFFPFGLTVGYGATYQGKFALNLPTLAAPTVFYAPGYLVHNANISYEINKSLSLQVNVKNIGDKLYYNRIRANSGWATPGDARSAVATLTYKM